MAENCIGAAIWKWNFNRITSNVLRVLAKDDAQCRRVDKTVFMMVIGGIVGAQVVKKIFLALGRRYGIGVLIA